jgi:hypothetical protein
MSISMRGKSSDRMELLLWTRGRPWHDSTGRLPETAKWRVFRWAIGAILAGTLLAPHAALALTTGAPSLEIPGDEAYKAYGPYGHDILYVYPTRLYVRGNVKPNGLATKWRAEYISEKSSLEKGSWIVAGSGARGVNAKGVEEESKSGMFFGPSDPDLYLNNQSEAGVLHHLVPHEHYYARFIAENADGATQLPFEFTTPSASAPEIARDGYSPPGEGTNESSLSFAPTSPTSVSFKAQLETNGAATNYSVGYSTSPSGSFTSCASGSVSVAEDYAELSGSCTGLAPEKTYYVLVKGSNEKGTFEQRQYRGNGNTTETVTTPTAKPIVFPAAFRNVTATSAHATDALDPHQLETSWRLEYAPSLIGPWSTFGEGTVSRAEAEALPEYTAAVVGAPLTGLSPEKTYYVRLIARNAAGEGVNESGEPVSTETRGIESFTTESPPTASTFAVHSLDQEALRLIGTVNPDSALTYAEQTIALEGSPTGGTFTLSIDGHVTAPIAYNANGQAVERAFRQALKGVVNAPGVTVEGPDGGPYTVVIVATEGVSGETVVAHVAEEPPIEGDGAGLTPASTVHVTVIQRGADGYDARYRFQYMSQHAFEAQGSFAGPEVMETEEGDAGTGTTTEIVGSDVSGLTPGETYRYRLVATSTFPGNPHVYGAEQTVVAPGTPAPTPASSCPNEALRVGASANLPDCRAYELLTPIEKNGAPELLNYGLGIGTTGVAVSEDGNHVMVQDELITWQEGPGAGESPFFFSREEAGTWGMTTGSLQPETGVSRPLVELVSPDLGQYAFASSYFTSVGHASKEVEYKVGPAGGPYSTVATVPVADLPVPEKEGWVASSRDFSKLVLAAQDRSLAGGETGTIHGDDLYEYTGGELRQVNVTGAGAGVTIGSCGASMVIGHESDNGSSELSSSPNAISADGSRVFFEATPSSKCSEAKHLYMREDGEGTVDIGAYVFLAANEQGTVLVLERRSGSVREFVLYETESAVAKTLFTVHGEIVFKISEDLGDIYFVTPEKLTSEAPVSVSQGVAYLYHYDIASGTLTFLDSGLNMDLVGGMSADGRELYFQAGVVGGAPGGREPQVYRYDSAEGLIQCMSCASPFDPEPKLIALFGETGGQGGIYASHTGLPRVSFASDNGDYVFFDTPSALVPSDIDGEVAPESAATGSENQSKEYSLSSDVYEWRKPGVDGCTHVQGCLALITNGRGGFLNTLLGTDASGRDVFIHTRSKLVPQDRDTAGDVYDARIGGGSPLPPPRPLECEGDACASPFSAPLDATPSSLTFSGFGNVVSQPSSSAKQPSKAKRTRHKNKTKAKSKRHKAKRTRGKKASRAAHVGRANRGVGR